jgi:uncharacterized alkaline shock family protein YloU
MDTVAEGKITVAPGVLLDIVEQAALYSDGVVGMASIPARVDRIFRKLISGDGIELEIRGDSVIIDLYLIVRAVDLVSLGHRVQQEVMRAMDKLVGLKVDAVNIHVEDIYYPENQTA